MANSDGLDIETPEYIDIATAGYPFLGATLLTRRFTFDQNHQWVVFPFEQRLPFEQQTCRAS
jgi:hypothetical protein